MLFRNRLLAPFHPPSWIPQRLSLPFYCESSDVFPSFPSLSSLVHSSLADPIHHRSFLFDTSDCVTLHLFCLFHQYGAPAPVVRSTVTLTVAVTARVALSFAPTSPRRGHSLSPPNQTICYRWPLRPLSVEWRPTAESPAS